MSYPNDRKRGTKQQNQIIIYFENQGSLTSVLMGQPMHTARPGQIFFSRCGPGFLLGLVHLLQQKSQSSAPQKTWKKNPSYKVWLNEKQREVLSIRSINQHLSSAFPFTVLYLMCYQKAQEKRQSITGPGALMKSPLHLP